MSLLDFLPGRRSRRARAGRLHEVARAPFGRLHAAIAEAGVAQVGERFEEIRTRFVDCRILRTEELANFPPKDRDALYKVVASLMPAIGPVHAEVRAAFEQVRRDWRHGGLIEAAAGGGLRALDALEAEEAPRTAGQRLMRIAYFLDVDAAASDVEAELQHVAQAPSLFW